MSESGYDIDPEETVDIPLRCGDLQESFILEPIKRLMTVNVDCISPQSTALDAAIQMTQGGFGCVVVTDEGRVVGIFTERDLMNRVVAEGLDPAATRMAEVMSPNPESVEPDDALAYGLNIMAVGGFRHVPVIDEEGCLKGIFSLRDLQKALVGHFGKDILTLPPRPTHFGPSRRFAG